eukprot:gnl/MRDRNA2_/MRDRNA2_86119_c0_seq2.p1 gnl/MRDRNA2_/MRDRNA2_86119_c0~~gnl/MRDRNA2_/MRDRNA2_86119_c0_seq2.p1  ORF type:complete len:514 (+),score=151.44 gnl/MRDRNA2_/MRDRNA2_86119_c0_seq2:98-1639(+)
MSSSSSQIMADVMVEKTLEMEAAEAMVKNTPEMEDAEAAKDKKKKKKEKKKGIDLEDMYSFDADKLEKAKPAKRKKESTGTGSGEITLAQLQNTMKFMARIEEKNQPKQQEHKQEGPTRHDDEKHDEDLLFPDEDEIRPTGTSKPADKVEEKDKALHRFPSPSRSRQGSPKKRDESPKKPSMKASAAEFVPPGVISPAKETSSSGFKASAKEFVPPGFESLAKKTSSLQAGAAEFVPPGFEPKPCSEAVSESIPDVIPSTSEPSQTCWAHALLPPAPTEMTQPPKVPALTLNLGEASKGTADGTSSSNAIDACDAKWSARLDAGSILGKLQKSLTASLTGTKLTPNPAVDPCSGKVLEKVRRIEEKEADNEAEKEREAAIKVVQKQALEEKNSEMKRKHKEMDDTLMDCFLQAVKTRVKDRDLPIMGTTLYGKHMRASRRIGTSCDVKDSSFVWLRPFLESLEDANLLKLKPEVKDPTVIWINRNHKMLKDWEPWHFKDTVGSQKACGRPALR